MLFDQLTPDTSIYMIAGYSIFFVITVIYLASLFIRARNLRRDLETLESLEAEAQVPPAAIAQATARPRRKRNQTAKPKTKQARRKTTRK